MAIVFSTVRFVESDGAAFFFVYLLPADKCLTYMWTKCLTVKCLLVKRCKTMYAYRGA
jgi:hypothetical protein